MRAEVRCVRAVRASSWGVWVDAVEEGALVLVVSGVREDVSLRDMYVYGGVDIVMLL